MVNTYISLQNKSTTTPAFAAEARINSFTFAIQGTSILENVPRMVGNYETEKAGSSVIIPTSATALAMKDRSGVVIHWGKDTRDRTYNSGGISFSTVNYSSASVNSESVIAADTDLVVCHEYIQLMSLDGANGIIQVAQNT